MLGGGREIPDILEDYEKDLRWKLIDGTSGVEKGRDAEELHT